MAISSFPSRKPSPFVIERIPSRLGISFKIAGFYRVCEAVSCQGAPMRARVAPIK
jgi:hypothetical protein